MAKESERERFKVALCQCSSVLGDEEIDPRPPNMAKACNLVGTSASLGAKLIVFGEVFLTGYETKEFFPRYATRLDPPDGEIERLLETAKKHDVFIIMGMTTRGEHMPGDLYNTTVLVGPGGLIGAYSKAHLSSRYTKIGEGYRLSVERAYWSPGREIPIFPTRIGNIGISICYDICFPEVARVQTLSGAHLLVNTAAAPHGVEGAWDRLLPARAAENQIWCVMTGVVGRQRSSVFFGGSRVVDPAGETTARCKDMQEDLVIAEIDYSKMQEIRESSHQLSNRNPELYSVICERARPLQYSFR